MTKLDIRLRRRTWVYGILGALALIGTVFVLSQVQAMILPVIFGAILAYLLRPIKDAFKYSWMPEKIRIGVIVLSALVLLTGIFQGISQSLPTELEKTVLLVRLQYKINHKWNEVFGKKELGYVRETLKERGEPIMVSLNKALHLSDSQVKLFEAAASINRVDPKFVQYFMANANKHELRKQAAIVRDEVGESKSEATPAKKEDVLGDFLSVLSAWLLMPLVFIFMLFDGGGMRRYLIDAVPNRYFELTVTVLEEVDEALGNYLRGTFMECALVGLSLGVGLYVIGLSLQACLLIGFVAGFLNAIPFLGPAIGLVVGLFYALINESLTPLLPFVNQDNLMVAVFGVVAVAQLLDNTYFQPVILGKAVNLHPLVVILGVTAASYIFGFAGLLLAIPTIVVFKVIFKSTLQGIKAYEII